MGKKGYLLLENGEIYEGWSFGFEKNVEGEVVFNTGMVGYPEGYTDPSYFGQILIQTFPLIGNYGVPHINIRNGISCNFESENIQIRGLVVSQYIHHEKHWQSQISLKSWLNTNKIPAISGIDTRSLTQMLREKGVMKGAISFNKPPDTIGGFSFTDINKENLVAEVSCKKIITYGNSRKKILLFDCGVKNNIIRHLLKRNFKVIRVPWDHDPFIKNAKFDYDAVVISPGPGDPKIIKKTIEITKKVIREKIPLLGICLGNQILALAIGADTYKLKYGHRGQNQPVRDHQNNRCFITTQNHGFAVNTKTLPQNWLPWFTNLNDNTNEGIRHNNLPFVTVQFHPEAKPGPQDTEWIFDYFVEKLNQHAKKI
ncbi:carbamoyl phosphate synthase small subunit [Candidatus Gottesmanbacteria bacterium RBG_16_37_8]|uniref:Carbamoyl phosphate synthase small chain n=1 Tax=Candidatus Gottesmanbacteria bacterium RBG_16_37_8 TaxID=1798371 RepID=A0A1F5YVR6_9BACT|nr:MAG: carbamoyl phosphate synthase small subunit [Candidatus Gottesmanbacteria bacterium RBG_16_37_8]